MAELESTITMNKDKAVINTKLATAGHRAADKKVADFAGHSEHKKAGRVV